MKLKIKDRFLGYNLTLFTDTKFNNIYVNGGRTSKPFAGYESNPLDDGTLDDYFTVFPIEMNKLVTAACEGLDLSPKLVARTKNFFALGVLYYMYDRPLEATEKWLEKKFAGKDSIIEANKRAMSTGYNYADTTEIFMTRYKVEKAALPPGNYRNMNGNLATSLGLLAAGIQDCL